MIKILLIALFFSPSFALEISMQSAKDNFTPYSTLDITAKKPFLCKEIKNDFQRNSAIICAFSKRPSSKIKNLQNEFFKIDTFYKKNTFFLRIKPVHEIKLIPQIFNLYKDNTIFTADVSISKRWLVIGYTKKLPLIESTTSRPDLSLNFPYYSDRDTLPYVGSLDLNGNPVHIKKVGDVKDYIRVKKLYNKKNYELAMETIEDVLQEYPDTLFKAELIYYKIKLYAQLRDYDNVVDSAKFYLKEYSGSSNIAEVLALIAQAYSKIGMNSDADYFFDRLFSEHKGSKFAQWGYIYKGEMLAAAGGDKEAIKFYKKALYSTADLEVAAHAAFNIAMSRIDVSPSDAATYIEKILKAKPNYFTEEYKDSVKMMETFADEGDYKTASDMANALVNALGISDDDYELRLSQRALWMAKLSNKEQGLQALKRYAKEFPDGDYIDKIELAKDSLFFDTTDENSSQRLSEFDSLIETYSGDSIGNRAIYEKAKLLLKLKQFNAILEMQDKLRALDEKYNDVEQIISSAAKGLMEVSLDKKECKEVIIIANDYNITLSDDWDDGIYTCAMKGGDYQLSKTIAKKNFQSKDLEFRKKWLYRYIKVDFATGNYSDVIRASKDLITLIRDDKQGKYKEVYRYLFDTYERLEKKEKLLSSILLVQKAFGTTYKDIERYVTMMTLGTQMKDDNLVIEYGRKVVKIQKDSHSFAQSPYVEFTLYQAYMNRENYEVALKIIQALKNISLSKIDKARSKYLEGMVLTKLWRDDEAQVSYDAAIAADPESPWAKLAKSAKEL